MKLFNIEACIQILDPIFKGKCKANLAWKLINLIKELEPELEKINQVKQKVVEEYALKNENGEHISIKLENGLETYDFGDNVEKVNSELEEVLNNEFEIKEPLTIDDLESIEIEPINLKFLADNKIVI